jgi:asparagine synthase (glutamine-hydrolysing)
MRMHHRGPDDTQFWVHHMTGGAMVVLGFHRLAINGLGPAAHQPLIVGSTITLCNGEIWNAPHIHHHCESTNISGSDCEALPVYYQHIPSATPEERLAATCRHVDGVFGLVLIDRTRQTIGVARDRIGIRSLYYAYDAVSRGVCVASELKGIPQDMVTAACPFPPGCCMTLHTDDPVASATPTPYWRIRPPFLPSQLDGAIANVCGERYDGFCKSLRNHLTNAVEKRLSLSDRPIGCVLSGGLDSTVITSIVCRLWRAMHPDGPRMRTYTIGMRDAEDLKWARMAAEHFDTDHHEFVLEESEFLSAIPDVIRQIESYDVTTVRASTGNWLLAKRIAELGKDTVIFCGDVADELLGGYRGFGLTTDPAAFDTHNVRMMRDIHRFDVLRCEKSFAGHGLEGRVPFADRDVVDLVMSAPVAYKMWDGVSRIEKDCLRRAFERDLPTALTWRRKEAFSDGVSKKTNSWFEIIQRHVASLPRMSEITVSHAQPYDGESTYYRRIFDDLYSAPSCIPYLWKQPFCDAHDPSARCLDNYEVDADSSCHRST